MVRKLYKSRIKNKLRKEQGNFGSK